MRCPRELKRELYWCMLSKAHALGIMGGKWKGVRPRRRPPTEARALGSMGGKWEGVRPLADKSTSRKRCRVHLFDCVRDFSVQSAQKTVG